MCLNGTCENFLYGFKAAPRGARAADSDGSARLPLRSRLVGLYRRSAGAKGKDGAGEPEEVTEPRRI